MSLEEMKESVTRLGTIAEVLIDTSITTEGHYLRDMITAADLAAAIMQSALSKPEKASTLIGVVMDPEILALITTLVMAKYQLVMNDKLEAQMLN